MQEELADFGDDQTPSQTEMLRQLYFRQLNLGQRDEKVDRALVSLVLDHARRVIAHPSRPLARRLATFARLPFAELALEETIEETPVLATAAPEDVLVEETYEKRFSCALMLDCSSSMSGDKHLLASIAVAVLLLDVPPRDSALSVFSSNASSIKNLGIDEAPAETVLRFLRSRPKGFTNIHKGLGEGLRQLGRARTTRRRVGILASDGRTTEGGDPQTVAKRFDFLGVLHLHGPGSHIEASRAIAQAGNGICLEVETFDELPKRLYEILRLIARL